MYRDTWRRVVPAVPRPCLDLLPVTQLVCSCHSRSSFVVVGDVEVAMRRIRSSQVKSPRHPVPVSAMKPSPVLTAIARTVARTCEADDALILRLDGNSLELVAKHGRARTTGDSNETFRLEIGRAHV